METFGSRLAYLRSRTGLSQEELAERLKIAKSTLGMYETGKREPSHEMTARIADYFEVNIDWLTTGRESVYTQQLSKQELLLKEIVEKYEIDLERPGSKEKLEKIIQVVFEDVERNSKEN
ncbi:helix-turn-helix transcriptional regulator [Paenibacillus sp. RUD330]|uniref:helix-turn-helix domain-containing protein n=1 Tax=Paenibacillus sp. RUD330 TaxID=2023772 RepID=UPI000B92A53E|nr:helix-turn-helix transcriptional regulator [Paenibacillus sp. RUD330]ASS66250.1 helix-turn-helix transcriptional regulator [Paenibacillus sp. RUD330]